MAMQVTVAVEGPSDEVVARRILECARLEAQDVYVQGGKAHLDANLPRYNQAAQYAPWLVIRDLNSDAGCAPDLLPKILPGPSPQMRFRLAVHAVEAWLLADHERMSAFLKVDRSLLPSDPDAEPDPKRALVALARRSRKKAIRDDMVPEQGVSSQVGAGYVGRLIEFASTTWRPEVAAKRSDSLARCIRALKEWGSK